MLIAIHETASKLDKSTPLIDRLKDAMKLMKNHWLIYIEDEQFRCAVGAALKDATPEECEKIEAEMVLLNAVSASFTGVPVDFQKVLEQQKPEPLQLMKLWKEIKA